MEREKLLITNNLLNEQTDKLKACRQIALETEEIGHAILNDLSVQHEQIQRTSKNLSKAEANIDQSGRILKNMSYSWYNPLYWFN